MKLETCLKAIGACILILVVVLISVSCECPVRAADRADRAEQPVIFVQVAGDSFRRTQVFRLQDQQTKKTCYIFSSHNSGGIFCFDGLVGQKPEVE